MEIKQWEDKNLSHFSYAVVSNCTKKIILIDPVRNPQQYLDFAHDQQAEIIGIIETHPHADFVSSHQEISWITGATVYTSKDVQALYKHQTFDNGDTIDLGKIRLHAINTPGHSPDSICIVLEHEGKQKAVFTGDTLFIGDCGRPDLRESAGNVKTNREYLAKQMYHSLRKQLAVLPDDVIVYPAHGAGTLCGKAISNEKSSTIGIEKQTNWSLQEATEADFVNRLLADQSFVPAYFPYDVEVNRKGAPAFAQSTQKVIRRKAISNTKDSETLDSSVWIIDGRHEKEYKRQHLPHSINLMAEGKFETWLGSIIQPGEEFYLAGQSLQQVNELIERAAVIGYESFIKEAFVIELGNRKSDKLDLEEFKSHQQDYTIVDVRNSTEQRERKIFPHSLHIPLPELRQRIQDIPFDKPIIVHCAGGYRSAAASSLIGSQLDGKAMVYDLGEAVRDF